MAVDISMLGDKGLERMLKELPDKAQNKVVRGAIRNAARFAKNQAAIRAPRDTGKLATEMKKVKPRAGKRSRSMISVVVPFPTREAMGIPAESKWFYPAHVEYGHGNVPPKPYIRPAVDENYDKILRMVANALRNMIPKEAAKLAKS